MEPRRRPRRPDGAPAALAHAAVGPRAVVLVEGDSDRVALLTLAARLGHDLHGVEVVAMGGVTNLRAHLRRLGPPGLDLPLAGLYDAPAARWVRSVLADAQVPADGFHACDADLEDELVRALGVEAAEQVVADAGEARALRRLAAMPAQRGWTSEHVLHRFLGSRSGRKAAYARLLVEALPPGTGPAPLRAVLERVAG